jgi:hypothetical protein
MTNLKLAILGWKSSYEKGENSNLANEFRIIKAV